MEQRNLLPDSTLIPSGAWIYGDLKKGSKATGWIINFQFVGDVMMKDRKAFVVVQQGTDEPLLSQKLLQEADVN